MTDATTRQASTRKAPKTAWSFRIPEVFRFPYREIVGNRRFGLWVAKFIWFAVPLEFYVLTRFSGGLVYKDFIAVALIALLTVFAVLAFAMLMALLQFPRGGWSYEQRVRSWSVSLLLNWTGALLLLAIGYAINEWRGVVGSNDVVWPWIFSIANGALFINADYPRTFDPGTFLVYLCYSVGSVVLIKIVAKRFGKAPQEPTPAGPNVFAVVVYGAFIMMVLHGVTRWT